MVSRVSNLIACCGAIFSLVAGGQQQQTAAISGIVTSRTDGAPLAGAIVSLRGQAAGISRIQRTDEKGRFVFAELAADSYLITAAKSGFADERQSAASPLGGRQVQVTQGEWFPGLRIQLMSLGGLSGRIVDDTGHAIAGAYVRLLRPFTLFGRDQLAAGPVARTDDTGVYQLSDLLPGSYYLVVPSVQHSVLADTDVATLEGRSRSALAAGQQTSAALRLAAPERLNGGLLGDGDLALVLGNYPMPSSIMNRMVYAPTFFPGTTNFSAASIISVDAGTFGTGFDIVVRAQSSVRVCGRLMDLEGASAGNLLRLLPAGLESLGVGSEAATTIIKTDGQFCFPRVAPGSYSVLSTLSTFEFTLGRPTLSDRSVLVGLPRTPGVPRTGPAASDVEVLASRGITYTTHLPTSIRDVHALFSRTSVTVGADDINNLDIRLERSGAIEGHIYYEDLAGPPPKGSAELAAATGDPTLGASFAPLSESGDRFLAPALAPGEYALRFPTSGLTIVSLTANGRDVSRSSIPVLSGATTVVAVTLSGKPTSVSGALTGMERAAEAVVIAFPTDTALWRNYGFSPTWIRTARVSKGRYAVSRLRPGEYYVVAVGAADADAWTDPKSLARLVGQARRIAIAKGDNQNLDLQVPGK